MNELAHISGADDGLRELACFAGAGGGSKHRKEIGVASTYSWLKKNKYPEGFRVLCWNCNSSLGLYGYSPADKSFR